LYNRRGPGTALLLLLRLVSGATLVAAAIVALTAALNAAAHYLVPALGPIGWAMVAILGVCGLMVTTPVIAAGVVLLHPRYSEHGPGFGSGVATEHRRARARIAQRQEPDWLQELLRPPVRTDPPRLSERYGYRVLPLWLVAGTAVAAIVAGFVLFPAR
jgi:hypothetical protein